MPTLKTMRVKLYPAEKTDFGYRLTIPIGRPMDGATNFEFEVRTPDELEAKLTEILANATPFPGTETFPCNAWRVSIDPANGRWAPGWKARYDNGRTVLYDAIATPA